MIPVSIGLNDFSSYFMRISLQCTVFLFSYQCLSQIWGCVINYFGSKVHVLQD